MSTLDARALPASDGPLDWSARWYLWDGGFLALGRASGMVPPHAHHAIQIALGVDGPVRVANANGDWQTCGGALVQPDVVHSYNGNGSTGALLFVDPESAEGAWLRASLTTPVTVIPERRLEACVVELRTFLERPLDALDTSDLIRHCVRALSAGSPPARRLDRRVAHVLAAIHAAPDPRLTLEDAAALVFLSPGRFAHLFAEHVGLPFRRYVLWRKLTRALLAIGRGGTLTEAAHTAAFADAAHFTRTCNRMFGIPPSVMLRGEFFEVPAPFGLHGG